MKTRHIYTELSTPCTMTSVSESIPHLPLRSLKTSQVKIMDISNTFQSPIASLNQTRLAISQSQLCLTQRKPSKISILPLTREKVRVTHKARRRADGSGNVSASGFYLNPGNSRKQIENAGKSYA
jgi:hypothetical protein